jgi:hypothetical protein
MEGKKTNSKTEEELILMLHDLSMSNEGGKAIAGKLCKEHMPLYMRFMDIELQKGTDRFDLVMGVVSMIVGMSLMLLYGYDKKQRARVTEAIISIFSERFREIATCEDFPETSNGE